MPGFVSWKIYANHGVPVLTAALIFKYVNDRKAQHVFPMSQYYADAAAGTLPNVSFVDPKFLVRPATSRTTSTRRRTCRSARSSWPTWSTASWPARTGAARRCSSPTTSTAASTTTSRRRRRRKPDNIPPILQSGDTPGAFDRYGIRVPAVVISPFSKSHYVSHVVDDHTSILRFIEFRFGLPALTIRDLNADPMLDMFDFSTPHFMSPPTLPAAVVDPASSRPARAHEGTLIRRVCPFGQCGSHSEATGTSARPHRIS